MELLKEITKAQFHGLIIFLIGFLLVWFVQRRRFNRRGVAGQQQYSSNTPFTFEIGCLTTILESILMLLGAAGILLGLFMIAIDFIN